MQELPGPVGERNVYVLKPRGRVVALADSEPALLLQLGAILATGNRAVLETVESRRRALSPRCPRKLPRASTRCAAGRARRTSPPCCLPAITKHCGQVNRRAARLDGPIIVVQGASAAGLADGSEDYALELLLSEVSISTNTAAAGGNAKLMTIG